MGVKHFRNTRNEKNSRRTRSFKEDLWRKSAHASGLDGTYVIWTVDAFEVLDVSVSLHVDHTKGGATHFNRFTRNNVSFGRDLVEGRFECQEVFRFVCLIHRSSFYFLKNRLHLYVPRLIFRRCFL